MALKRFAAAGESPRRPSGAGSPAFTLLILLVLLTLGRTSAQRSVRIQQHLYALQPQTASHQGATQACGGVGQLALATTAAGLQALRQLCGQHPCWVQDSHIVGLCPYIREGRVYQGQCETPRHYVCQKEAPPEHASPSGHQEGRQAAGPRQQLGKRQGKPQGQQYPQRKARTLQQDGGAAASPPPTNSSAAQALAALQPLLERLQSGGDLSADAGTGIVMMPIIVPSQNGPHTIYALLPGGTQRSAPAPTSPSPSPSPSPTPSVRAADGPSTPAGNQATDPSVAFWMALLRRSPAPSPSPPVTTQTSNIDLLAALLQAQQRLQQEGTSPTASSPSTLPSPGPPSVLTASSPQLPTPSPGSASPSPSPSPSPAPSLNSSSPASGTDASPLQSPPIDSSPPSSPEPLPAQTSPSPSSEDAQPPFSPSSSPAASPTPESPLPSPDLQSPSPSLPNSPSHVPQTTGPAGSSSPTPATSPATASLEPSTPSPALQTSPGSLTPPSPPSLLDTSALPEEQRDSRAAAATTPGDSPSPSPASTPTILGLAIALPLALVLGVAASLLFMRWRHRQQAFKTRITRTLTPSPHPAPSTQRSATTTVSSTIGLRHAAHSAAAASPSQGNSTDASGEDAASGPLQRLMTGGMTSSDLLQAVYALTAAVAASESGPAALQQPKRAPRGPDLPPDSFASTDSGRSRDPTQHGGSRPARAAGDDAGHAAGARAEEGRRARQAYAPEDAFLPAPGGGPPHRHTHPSAGQGVFNMHALDANARQPPSRWPAVQHQDREEASASNHPPAHVSVTPPAARPSAAATARMAKGSTDRTQPAASGETRAPSPAPWPFPPSIQPSSTDEQAYYDREASYAPDSPDEQPWQPEAQAIPQPASSSTYSKAARTAAGAPPTSRGEPPRPPGTSQPAIRHPSVAGGASGATRVPTRGGTHVLQDPLPPEDQDWAAEQPQGQARKAYGAGAVPAAMQYKEQEEEEGEQRQERVRTAAADLSPQQAANHLLDALMLDMRRHQECQQQQRQKQQQR